MNIAEEDIWSSLILVIRNFLGNYKVDNFSEQVESMLSSFHQLSCKISIKVYSLHSYPDCFPENLGDQNEEQGRKILGTLGYPHDDGLLLVHSM